MISSMKLTLLDQGGNQLPRFGARGVRSILINPVKSCDDSPDADYAMVRCEESDVYIMRVGKGARSHTLTIVYWTSNDIAPVEENFQSSEREIAIKKFLKLCKEVPANANLPS